RRSIVQLPKPYGGSWGASERQLPLWSTGLLDGHPCPVETCERESVKIFVVREFLIAQRRDSHYFAQPQRLRVIRAVVNPGAVAPDRDISGQFIQLAEI